MNTITEVAKKTMLSIVCILLIINSTPAMGILQQENNISTFIDPSVVVPTLDGSVLYVGGSGPNNYSKIQDAIDNATAGDTVFVFAYSSPYYEHVVVNISIDLIGENRETTVIDGSFMGDVISVSADSVTIKGFTIQNGHYGILLTMSSYHFIEENNFVENLHGVSVQNSSFIVIVRNLFTDNQYGIRLFSSSRLRVFHNNFKSYKLHAFFIGTSQAHSNHLWMRNYWENIRILPYPILGKITRGPFSVPRLNFDWFPLKTPYMI
jgi:parallel beta-helix repeat protein